MTKRAYTLLEAMTLIALIGMLAALSVPNFLEAQVRSKVARAKVDMALLSTALRAYYADHNRYPPNDPVFLNHMVQAANPTSATVVQSASLENTNDDLYVLTSPLPYLSRALPMDPFPPTGRTDEARRSFSYVNVHNIISSGPQEMQKMDAPVFIVLSPGAARNYPGDPATMEYLSYDPTNGTVSEGQIIRFSDERWRFGFQGTTSQTVPAAGGPGAMAIP